MDIKYISEPALQFGAGTHLDIRFGMMNYGPLDALLPKAPKQISVGIVGTPETAEGIAGWFERCASGVEAKPSRQPNMFVRFPGYGPDQPLPAPIIADSANLSIINDREIRKLFKQTNNQKAIQEAVDLFYERLQHLAEEKNVNVLICAPPAELWDLMDRGSVGDETGHDDEDEERHDPDFHDLLKAKGLSLNHPIQVIWPPTYTGKRVERNRKKRSSRPLQDEATRAWNLYTALYYKVKGVPWRLVRDPTEYVPCYVGISFYKSLDEETTQTSVAQVFNERGEGLILKGGPAAVSKDDRQLHLSEKHAYDLLAKALDNFKREHKTMPARIVIHKTSSYSDEEKDGLWAVCEERGIELMDLLNLRRSLIRLFRTETYPPLRGTFISFDRGHNVLYTRGSIDFYRTFPGRYPPRTLEFEVADAGTPSLPLAEEILKLTKMSWNNTQVDNLMPVTIEAARSVSDLLKYADGPNLASSYRYYM